MTERILLVADLRPLPAIDAELDWFFNQAECDMGASSNFDLVRGAMSTAPRITPEDAVEAAHLYRRVLTWLRTIADSDAGVLQAAYELRDWPVALFDELGRLTGIVVKLACALDGVYANRDVQQRIEAARAEWLVSSGAPLRRSASLAPLRRAAEVRFCRAHRAYEAVRTHTLEEER